MNSICKPRSLKLFKNISYKEELVKYISSCIYFFRDVKVFFYIYFVIVAIFSTFFYWLLSYDFIFS